MNRAASRSLWLVPFAALGVMFALVHGPPGPRFRPLEPGVEFGTLRGDPVCRSGSSVIAVLRLDPARVRLRVLHYTREPAGRPLNILEWQRTSKALAVFNAGQFYPDFSYMGLLVSAGHAISSQMHPRFKAVLVATPDPATHSPRRARVLDLGHDSLDAGSPGWAEVAQSFMLFDRAGTVRVRKGTQVANRTAVAEDRQGRLVVFTTEGGYTLIEFAQLLRHSPLHLTHAMSMDGGLEAEMCVSTDHFHYASFGRWDGAADVDVAGAHAPLPAVIAVIAE